MLSAVLGALAVGLVYGWTTDTLLTLPSRRALGAGSTRTATPRPANAQKKPSAGTRRSSGPEPPLPVAVTDPSVKPWLAVAGGLLTAGLLAASLTFWNWATQAKLYTLHYVFVAGVLWLAVRTRHALITADVGHLPNAPRWSLRRWPPPIRRVHSLAVLIGLALTNHYMSLFLLPGVAVLLLTPARPVGVPARRVLRHLPTLILAAGLPLLLYLYLPIRARMQPLLNWGEPDTLTNFWRHITVSQYQNLIGGIAGTNLSDGLIRAANQFTPGIGVLLLGLIGGGVVYLARHDRVLLAASAITALGSLGYALNFQIREIDSYYVPVYMILLWWAGLGLAAGWGTLTRQLGASARWAAAWPVQLAGAGLLPLVVLGLNWSGAGHRNDDTTLRYLHNAYQNFQPNALVLTNWWDLTSGSY